jgi:hypothetical protein
MPNPNDLILIGILLLALVTVESGGYFLTRRVRGHVPANRLQMSFFRAGHAHAAVLLVLSIAILSVISPPRSTGSGCSWPASACRSRRSSCPRASSCPVLGKDPERPNRLIALLWVGVVSLTAALITAGIGLIAGGVAAL